MVLVYLSQVGIYRDIILFVNNDFPKCIINEDRGIEVPNMRI
jgi:hypothetical protein